MDENLIILKPPVSNDIDRILFLCDCQRGSGGCEIIHKETIEVVSALKTIAKPLVSLCFTRKEIYCVMTIGEEASVLSGKYFDHGDCVKGLIADNACDDLIFSLEEEIKPFLQAECKKRKIGIKRRLEAPSDIPMEEQRKICKYAHANEIGVTLLESLMLSPLKSTCFKYIVSEKCMDFNAKHDCSNCPQLDCKMRNKYNNFRSLK